jgi:hypothetical protein
MVKKEVQKFRGPICAGFRLARGCISDRFWGRRRGTSGWVHHIEINSQQLGKIGGETNLLNNSTDY